MSGTEVVALSAEERRTFRACEKAIKDGSKVFLDVGRALAAIRDGRLYRESWRSFEEYVRQQWGWERSRVYQLIESAEVVENIGKVKGPKPENEGQTRPLSRLEPERRAEAWQAAVERADGKPTAAVVESVVEEYLAEERVCPNCGSTEFDEDGDCAKCREPVDRDDEETPVTRKRPSPEEKPEQDAKKVPGEPAGDVLRRMKAANHELEQLALLVEGLPAGAQHLENAHFEASGSLSAFGEICQAAAGVVRAARGDRVHEGCKGKGCQACHGTGWATAGSSQKAAWSFGEFLALMVRAWAISHPEASQAVLAARYENAQPAIRKMLGLPPLED